MDFDAIIMYPPCNNNLHLKILDNVIEEFPNTEIVNLAPIQWLQDPTAEYKKTSAFNKFENVRNHIEDLSLVDANDVFKQLNIATTIDAGIYYITKKGGWQREENKLLKKMISRMQDFLKNHIVIDDLDGISLLVTLIAAGGGKGGIDVIRKQGFLGQKDKTYYTNKHNEATGETYEEYRKRVAWGNCGIKSKNTNIKFNSREERDNFYDSYNTKTLRYLFSVTKTSAYNNVSFLPWLGNYTRPWTDKDLYEYFDLTPEEIEEIESTVQ